MEVDTAERERADRRHLSGFRKFQRAAVKALSEAVKLLDGGGEDERAAGKAAVKVSDMKSLVSTYKEAVVGERMVLGVIVGGYAHESAEEPAELCLRWVIDDTAGPGGAVSEDE